MFRRLATVLMGLSAAGCGVPAESGESSAAKMRQPGLNAALAASAPLEPGPQNPAGPRPRQAPLELPGHPMGVTREEYGMPGWVSVPTGPEASSESFQTPNGQQMRLVLALPPESLSDLAPTAHDPYFHGGSTEDLLVPSTAAIENGCYRFGDQPDGWVAWKLKHDFTPADLRLFRFLLAEPGGNLELHVNGGASDGVYTARRALPAPDAEGIVEVAFGASDGWTLTDPRGAVIAEALSWEGLLDTSVGQSQAQLFGETRLDYPAGMDEPFRPGLAHGVRLVHAGGPAPCVQAFELGWYWAEMGAEHFFTRVFLMPFETTGQVADTGNRP